MARPFPEDSRRENGIIEIIKDGESGYHVIFTPPEEALRPYENPEDKKASIIYIHNNKEVITFHPFRVWGLQSMAYRYNTLKNITVETGFFSLNEPETWDIEELLAKLPEVFITDYNYGLGFRKEYRHIPEFLETIDVKSLIVKKNTETFFDKENRVLTISVQHLNSLRKKVDSITNRARKVAANAKHEVVAEMMFDFLRAIGSGKHVVYDSKRIREKVTKTGILPLNEVSGEKQDEAIEIVKANSRKILKEQPRKLVKLRSDIEIVTIEELIVKFESMLKEDLKESYWQALLEENPFILNLAFGSPIVKIRGNASVGGRTIFGGGDKIVDFLVKNRLSNNAAIVEIKRPSTKLVHVTSYRTDVFGPTVELSGAVNQILDQINRFQEQIAYLKVSSKVYDMEAYSVAGILIVGKLPTDATQIKGFELYRGNSKNIHIITFDELLEKLKQLRAFLVEDNREFINGDLPF